MAEVTKQARSRARRSAEQAEDAGGQAKDDALDVADERDDDSNGAGGSGSGGTPTIAGELKDTFREAAIEVLKPVMRKATTSAAKYAVTQGPSLVMDKVAPKVKEAGGAGALAKGVASRGGGIAEKVGGVASGIGGTLSGKKKEGKSPSGTGRGRRLPVQEYVDVGVDLETAYEQFTQFEDWPKFMHRVERIEQRDDSTLMWHENIWGVRRSWEVEITDQEPCERIAWRSTNGPQTIGVVTFHRLSDRLTRIYVTVDFQPKGLFEKTASGTRISRRALTSDLMRFKAFIELRDEATGGWHGRIDDGEVVEDEEQREDDERPEDDEPRASEDDEGEEPEYDEGEEPEDEPQASEDDDDYDEEEEPADEDEDEDDEPRGSRDEDEPADDDEDAEEEPEKKAPPRRRRRTATASAGRNAR